MVMGNQRSASEPTRMPRKPGGAIPRIRKMPCPTRTCCPRYQPRRRVVAARSRRKPRRWDWRRGLVFLRREDTAQDGFHAEDTKELPRYQLRIGPGGAAAAHHGREYFEAAHITLRREDAGEDGVAQAKLIEFGVSKSLAEAAFVGIDRSTAGGGIGEQDQALGMVHRGGSGASRR